MKKTALYILTATMILSAFSGCAKDVFQGTVTTPEPQEKTAAAEAETPSPAAAEDIIAEATADELRVMIEQYRTGGSYEMMYAAALRLIELEPSDTGAYTAAMDALIAMSSGNYEQINALLAQGVENAEDAGALAGWAEDNQPDISIEIPFVKKDPSQIETLSELGFIMDLNTNMAYYNDGEISIGINHAGWGETPVGYENEVDAATMYFQTDGGYYLIMGYYPDMRKYLFGIADEANVLSTFSYYPESGEYQFTNGNMETTEEILSSIFPDAENAMQAPISFYNDTLMDFFGLGAAELYALPYDPLTLSALGFEIFMEEGFCTYFDIDKGADIEIYKDGWKMQSDEWKKNVIRFYKTLDGYYLEVAYYPGCGIFESHMYEGEESNDYGVQSYIKYDLSNGVLLDAVNQNSDLEPEEFFAGALGTERMGIIYADVFAQFENYTQEKFGMTPDELFEMDAE